MPGCSVSLRNKLRAFHRLPRRELAATARAWLMLLVTDLAVRRLPFPLVRSLLARGPAAPPPAVPVEVTELLARAVDRAVNHHLHPIRCLPRALVLQTLLRRAGVVTELRLGVRREADGISAHAWLEADGIPVGEPAGHVEQFAPLNPAGAATALAGLRGRRSRSAGAPH